MTENLQLENPLVTRLREIDFPIGERVYFEDYIKIAETDNEVNRMLGMPTAEEIREGVEKGNLYEKLVAKLGKEQVEATEKRLEINIKNTEFFAAAYKVLINKEKGPRLASFILVIGKLKIVELLDTIK